jgi:hypothetical protein
MCCRTFAENHSKRTFYMKKSLFFLLLGVLSWAACKNDKPENTSDKPGISNADMVRNPISADAPVDTNNLARLTFSETEFDFGEVNEGDIVEHKYKFTNAGKVPLTILKARSSCGCTVPEYPETPIAPGESGEITAKFNTDGKHNFQKKIIYVTANTYPSETSVLLKGQVKPKKEN